MATLKPEQVDAKVRSVELLISNLLRIGVMSSFAIILLGVTVTFVHHPDYFKSRSELTRLTTPPADARDTAFPHTLHGIVVGLTQFQGQSIVLLGLLVLIATPIMGVAISIFSFVYQRDRVFVVITSIVLCLLILSFFLGKAER